jgi:tRNA modification GTPase
MASAGFVRRLTAPGRSAIAVIEVRGQLVALDEPTSLFQSVNRQPLVAIPVGAIRFGRWGEYGEEVVLCRTGEDSVEMTCHGGEAAVAKVLSEVANRGFEIVSAHSASESSHAARLPDARTQRTAEILLHQASGVWSNFAKTATQADLAQADRWAEFGRHLTEPWDVALCGRPNVGKSSLMNAIAGFTRSIVSETAGTTRDLVTLETAVEGWPVRITDTAGVRETHDPIESEGVSRSLDAIRTADLAVILLDGSQPLQEEDRQLLDLPTKRRLVVLNKSDLPQDHSLTELGDAISISASSGVGIANLLVEVARQLVPELPGDLQPIPI